MEYRGLTYGYIETLEKKGECNIKTSGFQNSHCYSLMEVLPDFYVFSPENTGPLSITRVSGICFTFTYFVPVTVVGTCILSIPSIRNIPKLRTLLLYLFYK